MRQFGVAHEIVVRLRQPEIKAPRSRIFSCIWVMRARMTNEIVNPQRARLPGI